MKLPKGFGGQGFSGMLAQAQTAMARAKTLNEELEAERLEIDKGQIRMIFNGLGELQRIKIDPAIVDPEDVEMLEDMVLGAIRAGFEQAVQRREAKMADIMPNLPDLGI